MWPRALPDACLAGALCLALMLMPTPADGVGVDQSEAARRDAELTALMNAADLPAHLRQEAARIQSARQSVNSRTGQLNQELQALRQEGQRYNSQCRGQLSPPEASSCRSWRSRLESRDQQFRSASQSHSNEAARVDAEYRRFRGEVQAYRAAQQGADQGSWHQAWSRGRQDALNCSPSNAHGHCSGVGGDYASCQDGYSTGFQDGSGLREQRLQQAYQLGNQHGATGRENQSFGHPDAQGPCRIQWIQRYDQGHFEGRQGGGDGG